MELKNFKEFITETLITSSAYLDVHHLLSHPNDLIAYLRDSNTLRFKIQNKEYKIKAGSHFKGKIIKNNRQEDYIKALYTFIVAGKEDMTFAQIENLAIESFKNVFGPAIGSSIPFSDLVELAAI